MHFSDIYSSHIHAKNRERPLEVPKTQIATNWEYMCTVFGHRTTTHWEYMCIVVATPLLQIGYSQRRAESLDDCLSLEAETNFSKFFQLLSYIVGQAVPIGHS